MLLSKVRAVFGLYGKGTGTRPGVDWTPLLGTQAVSRSFPTADILYTVHMAGITNSVAPELYLNSGAIVANGATVSRTAAKDFETSTLPALVRIYAILFERLDADAEVMNVFRLSDGAKIWELGADDVQLIIGGGLTVGPGIGASTVLGFETDSAPTAPASIRVTVLGKSS